MRLSISLLEKTFAYVWQSGSFYRASKESGLSVNCLQNRVLMFERWLGVELYIKKKYKRGITLTKFGRYFLCCFGNDWIYPSAIISYRNW